jgi:hypothetical protein
MNNIEDGKNGEVGAEMDSRRVRKYDTSITSIF